MEEYKMSHLEIIVYNNGICLREQIPVFDVTPEKVDAGEYNLFYEFPKGILGGKAIQGIIILPYIYLDGVLQKQFLPQINNMTTEQKDQKSLGESRVRTVFNPGASALVDQIKQKGAEFIDLINAIPTSGSEDGRLKSLDLTEVEAGTMWAVKAATF